MYSDLDPPSELAGQTLEADSAAYALAVTTFVSWADHRATQARATFTPDTLIFVNSTDRRGWLLDEVYFVTIWADLGAARLRADLDEALIEAGLDVVRPKQSERDPQGLLQLGLMSSQPVGEVRHLL